jgi:hypothetical protein
MSKPGHEQTLVTALFDLQRREPGRQRGVEDYLRDGELVLGLQQPLVIWTEAALAERLARERDRRGLGELTRIEQAPLESLPWHTRLDFLRSCDTFDNHDPRKDTALYQVLNWSKFDLVERTMERNPFGHEHFAWIDFGIGHVAVPPKAFPAPTDRFSLLEMRAVGPGEIEDPLEFVRRERHRCAAGFLRGPAPAWVAVTGAFRQLLGELLDRSFRPNEQMVLAVLTGRHGEWFESYYGDYASILCNWDHLRRDVRTIWWNACHCVDGELWEQARRCTGKVLDDFHKGHLHLDRDVVAGFLDLASVAAWYSGDQASARKYLAQMLANCSQTPYFKRHRERLAENLRLMGQATDVVPSRASSTRSRTKEAR